MTHKGRIDERPHLLYRPTYEGKALMSSASDLMTLGIDRERARLAGSKFLTLLFNEVGDYDGVEGTIELLEGFPDETSAIQYVNAKTEETLLVCLANARSRDATWRHDVARDYAGIPQREGDALVQRVYLKGFHMTLGTGNIHHTGYNTKQFWFEVLQMNPPAAVGPDIFTHCEKQRERAPEWEDYFISKGKE